MSDQTDWFELNNKSSKGIKVISTALQHVWTEYCAVREKYIGQITTYLIECPVGSTLDTLICASVFGNRLTSQQENLQDNYGRTHIDSISTQVKQSLKDLCEAAGLDTLPRPKMSDGIISYIDRIIRVNLLKKYVEKCKVVLQLDYKLTDTEKNYLDMLVACFSGVVPQNDLQVMNKLSNTPMWRQKIRSLHDNRRK